MEKGITKPIFLPFEWSVGSRSRKTLEHQINLAEYGGNGSCSCEDFDFRLLPRLMGGQEISPRTRCKHIRAARESFTDLMIEKLTEGDYEKAN